MKSPVLNRNVGLRPATDQRTSSSTTCRTLSPLILAAALLAIQLPARATTYAVGDTVENFALTDRATGNPVQLTDFAGKIVVLDWFAWWCPFCQAAAPQLFSGIGEWYGTRGGNLAGIPVVHVGVNLQPGQETQTQNFVNRAKLGLVLQDFNRAAANRFASGGQPIFAIINGVTNSASHQPWELLYSRLGFGENSFPVGDFRTAIDAVKAPAVVPPTPPILSSPEIQADGRFAFVIAGATGRTYRLESSPDLVNWSPAKTFTTASTNETVQVSPAPGQSGGFFRAVVP